MNTYSMRFLRKVPPQNFKLSFQRLEYTRERIVKYIKLG